MLLNWIFLLNLFLITAFISISFKYQSLMTSYFNKLGIYTNQFYIQRFYNKPIFNLILQTRDFFT